MYRSFFGKNYVPLYFFLTGTAGEPPTYIFFAFQLNERMLCTYYKATMPKKKGE